MQQIKKILVLMIVCLWGCDANHSPETSRKLEIFRQEIKMAEDNTADIKSRLTHAQKADSIAQIEGNDSNRLVAKKIIAKLFMESGNNSAAKELFITNVRLAKTLHDYEEAGIDLNYIGLMYNDGSQYDSALIYYQQANEIFSSHKFDLQAAQSMENMAIVNKALGNLQLAFELSLTAARKMDSMKVYSDLGSAYTTVANILKDLNRLDDALHYHELALKLRKSEKDSVGVAGSLNNLGNVFRYKKMYDSAQKYYLQSLAIKNKVGMAKSIAITIDNLGETYFELQDYGKAEQFYRRSLELRQSTQDVDGYSETSNRLAKLYLKTGRVKLAEETALPVSALPISKKSLKQRIENKKILAEAYRDMHKYELADSYTNTALSLSDSLFNTEMARAISQMQTKYKTEEKEKELTASKLQTNAAYKFIILLVFFLLLLSVLSYLLYRSYATIKEANKKIDTLMDELSHRVKNNLQLIFDMLHLQKGLSKDEAQRITLQASINRVQSMNIIHKLLYKKEHTGSINMSNFLEQLMSNLTFTYLEKSAAFDVQMEIDPAELDINRAIPLGLIANEIMTNIFKYAQQTREKAILKLAFHSFNSQCNLTISDNCDPWDTNDARANGGGLGLFLIDTLTKQLNGEWKLESNDTGTIQSIIFQN